MQHSDISFTNKLAIVFLLLTPILYMYGVGVWSFNSYIYPFFAILAFLRLTKKVLSPIPATLLLLVFDSALVNIFTVKGQTFPIGIVEELLIYIVFWDYVNSENVSYYLKVFKCLCVLFAAFFYIQFLIKISTGYMISGVFPGIPFCESFVEDVGTFMSNRLNNYRCCSFFSEPSYFCRYLIPCITLELFKERNINWLLVVFLSLSVILSISASGIFVLFVIFIFKYINVVIKKPSRIISLTLLLFLSFYIIYSFAENIDVVSILMERQGELSMHYEGGSASGYLRLWRGLLIFQQYDLTHMLTGTQNIDVISSYEAMTEMGNLFVEGKYFNGISTLLLRQGFIGFALFIILLVELCRNTSTTGIAIVVSFIAYMLCESVYPGDRMAFFLIITSCLDKTTAKKLNLR